MGCCGAGAQSSMKMSLPLSVEGAGLALRVGREDVVRERPERLQVVGGVDGFERALRRAIGVDLGGVEARGGGRQREEAQDGGEERARRR